MNVTVLGATPNPERTASVALTRLRAAGHRVVGVNPALPDLGAVPVVATLAEVPEGQDTLTVYLSAPRQGGAEAAKDWSRYRRVIFNPGAENPELARRLRESGVEVVEACTLVLLATRQF